MIPDPIDSPDDFDLAKLMGVPIEADENMFAECSICDSTHYEPDLHTCVECQERMCGQCWDADTDRCKNCARYMRAGKDERTSAEPATTERTVTEDAMDGPANLHISTMDNRESPDRRKQTA